MTRTLINGEDEETLRDHQGTGLFGQREEEEGIPQTQADNKK